MISGLYLWLEWLTKVRKLRPEVRFELKTFGLVLQVIYLLDWVLSSVNQSAIQSPPYQIMNHLKVCKY